MLPLQRYSDLPPVFLRRFWIALVLALVLSLVLEVFAGGLSFFGWDGLPFIHALLGFGACTLIIGLSNLLGMLLKYPDTVDEEA